MKKNYLLFVIFFMLLISTSTAEASSTFKEWEGKRGILLDKEWSITFSDEVNPTTVNENTVYIISQSSEKKHPVKIEVVGRTIVVTPENYYRPNNEYTLHINKVYSNKDKELKAPVTMSFFTDAKGFIDNMRWRAGNYSGELLNSMPNGNGIWTSDEIGRKYEGQFKFGALHGNGLYNFPNGDSYKGSFAEGIRQGKGLYKWINGDSYDGDFVNGIMHGKGLFTWANGKTHYGSFKNGNMVNEAEEAAKMERYRRCLQNNLNMGVGGHLSGTKPENCSKYLE